MFTSGFCSETRYRILHLAGNRPAINMQGFNPVTIWPTTLFQTSACSIYMTGQSTCSFLTITHFGTIVFLWILSLSFCISFFNNKKDFNLQNIERCEHKSATIIKKSAGLVHKFSLNVQNTDACKYISHPRVKIN